MIEHRIWMFVTSADLEEMAQQARDIEKAVMLGDSCVVKDWYCGSNTYVTIVIDQERARAKGLMK